jgi:hypothetical protein
MKKKLFHIRKPVAELRKSAEKEMAVLEACKDLASENLHNFASGIEQLEAEAMAAAQAIREAMEAGVSQIRIRTMKNDLRILDRSLEKRKRMMAAFEGIHDLIGTAYDDVMILFEKGHYEEIIELIPEKALPHLIRSGDPTDIGKLKTLLIGINRDLEETLATIIDAEDAAIAALDEEERTTDVMIATSTRKATEEDDLDKKYGLGVSTAKKATVSEPVADVQPVKVSKKAADLTKTNS